MSQEETSTSQASSTSSETQKSSNDSEQSTMSSSDLASFRIRLNGPKRSEIIVNGIDISSHVSAIQVDASYSEIPRVVLEGYTLDTVLEGEGVVVVPIRPAPMAYIVRGLDPGEIEQAALARMQWDDRSLVEHVLDVLAEAMEEFDASQS